MKYIVTRKQIIDITNAIRKKYGYIEDSEVTSLDSIWNEVKDSEVREFDYFEDYQTYYNENDIVPLLFDINEEAKNNLISKLYQDITSIVYEVYITDLTGFNCTVQSKSEFSDNVGRVCIHEIDYDKFKDIIAICPYYLDETTNEIYKIMIEN